MSRTDALTLTTPKHLRGPAFIRLTRGVYAESGLGVDHGTRILAARVALGDEPVVSGISAAWAHGARTVDPDTPAEMTVVRNARTRAELVVRRRRLDLSEIVTTRFGLTTSWARTAYDVGRDLPLLDAVATLDALTRAVQVAVPRFRVEVGSVIARHPGARGTRSLRRALSLVDDGAESPQESRLRARIVLAGLARPSTQVVVEDARGRFVARVDLGWPEHRLAVEYDGAHHDTPDRIRRDRDRMNRLRLAGWTVIVVDRHQMRRPDAVVAMVQAVLRGAPDRTSATFRP